MKCPGQDTKYWDSTAIYEEPCPDCSTPVEFFKDDTARKCTKCGKHFINPKLDFGCASYCRFASKCFGTLPEKELEQHRSKLLKEQLAQMVKIVLEGDTLRIRFIENLSRVVEELARQEKVELPLVFGLAYLHLISKSDAEELIEQSGRKDVELAGLKELLADKKRGGTEWMLIREGKRLLAADELIRKKLLHSVKRIGETCETLQGRMYIDNLLKDSN